MQGWRSFATVDDSITILHLVYIVSSCLLLELFKFLSAVVSASYNTDISFCTNIERNSEIRNIIHLSFFFIFATRMHILSIDPVIMNEIYNPCFLQCYFEKFTVVVDQDVGIRMAVREQVGGRYSCVRGEPTKTLVGSQPSSGPGCYTIYNLLTSWKSADHCICTPTGS